MAGLGGGDYLKLQISAILRDNSLSLSEKEMVVFSILNASLLQKEEQRHATCSDYLIRTPKESLILKSPMSHTFSFKDHTEGRGFFEKLMAHHSLDSKAVFTFPPPEGNKDLATNFSINSFASFRHSRNSLEDENILCLPHKQAAKLPHIESIVEQGYESEREQALQTQEDDTSKEEEDLILGSKFHND